MKKSHPNDKRNEYFQCQKVYFTSLVLLDFLFQNLECVLTLTYFVSQGQASYEKKMDMPKHWISSSNSLQNYTIDTWYKTLLNLINCFTLVILPFKVKRFLKKYCPGYNIIFFTYRDLRLVLYIDGMYPSWILSKFLIFS